LFNFEIIRDILNFSEVKQKTDTLMNKKRAAAAKGVGRKIFREWRSQRKKDQKIAKKTEK